MLLNSVSLIRPAFYYINETAEKRKSVQIISFTCVTTQICLRFIKSVTQIYFCARLSNTNMIQLDILYFLMRSMSLAAVCVSPVCYQREDMRSGETCGTISVSVNVSLLSQMDKRYRLQSNLQKKLRLCFIRAL